MRFGGWGGNGDGGRVRDKKRYLRIISMEGEHLSELYPAQDAASAVNHIKQQGGIWIDKEFVPWHAITVIQIEGQ
jgi:hypothetical protein